MLFGLFGYFRFLKVKRFCLVFKICQFLFFRSIHEGVQPPEKFVIFRGFFLFGFLFGHEAKSGYFCLAKYIALEHVTAGIEPGDGLVRFRIIRLLSFHNLMEVIVHRDAGFLDDFHTALGEKGLKLAVHEAELGVPAAAGSGKQQVQVMEGILIAHHDLQQSIPGLPGIFQLSVASGRAFFLFLKPVDQVFQGHIMFADID